MTSNPSPPQASAGTPEDDRDPGAWLEDLAAGRTKQPAAPAEHVGEEIGPGATPPVPADIDLTTLESSPNGAGGDGPTEVPPDHSPVHNGSRAPEASDRESDSVLHSRIDAGDELAPGSADTDTDASDESLESDDQVLDHVTDPGVIAMEPDPDGITTETDADDTALVADPGDRTVEAKSDVAAKPDLAASPDETSQEASWLDLDRDDVSLTRTELAEVSGLTEPALADLEHYGLISTRRSGPVEVYGQPSLDVAMHAKAFFDKGLEARHLRMFIVSAEREAAFLQNVVAPLLHRRNDGGKVEATEILDELGLAGLHLRDALLRGLLETYLSDG